MAPQTFDVLGGYKIPAIGYGTYTITDEKELEDALEVALETGYRHIDTATLYKNEHIIGRVLKKWFDSGKLKREDIFVTTKLPGSVAPERVEIYIKKSLEQLQLDYVDLYLIHFPMCIKPPEPGKPFSFEFGHTDLVATWKKLEEQVDLGRTKTIGVSNFNKEQVGRIISNSRIKPASNQVELHVYLQQPELVQYCQDNGIVVVSYFSLANPGINQYLEKQGIPTRPNQGHVLKDATIKQIADKHNKSAAQVLLKFLLQKNIAVIPKSVTESRIKENFDLFSFTLDNDDIKAINGLDRGEKGRLSDMALSPAVFDHPEYPFPKPTK
jgi:diketogulonate reductase-like aldo/keto reductase